MPGINKTGNEYASELGYLFDEMPKAVIAAIAVSALTSGGDWLEKAPQRVAKEWIVLHEQGIVPQPPTKNARDLASLEPEL